MSDMYFFTKEAVVPVRRSASESSEMISQLLFGDTGNILAWTPSWAYIEVDYDKYRGWVDKKMLLLTEEKPPVNDPVFLIKGNLYDTDGNPLKLPLGVALPGYLASSDTLHIGTNSWKLGKDAELLPVQDRDRLPELVHLFYNAPYLWGGRSSWGIDCSGFTQQVFRMSGIPLLRDTSDQITQGKSIPVSERKAGDLAFFNKGGNTKVSHVGILYSENAIIHASGSVRLDFFEKNSIIHGTNLHTTHWLVDLKRI